MLITLQKFRLHDAFGNHLLGVISHQRHWFKIFLFLSLLFCAQNAVAQVVFQHTYDRSILEFLDEMNGLRLTDKTYNVLPLSRTEIAETLDEIVVSKEKLNERQQNQLQFFHLEYKKDGQKETRPTVDQVFTSPINTLDRFKRSDLAYFSNDKVTLSLNPIIGGTWQTNDNGVLWQRRVGADFQMYTGRIGVYANLRDVYQSEATSDPAYVYPSEGSLYKYNDDGSTEFSEMRGGITYGWKSGYIGLVKDHVNWGYGYYGRNILDHNAPSFTQLKLHLNPVDWLRFDYFHGWLNSDVIDSNRTSQLGSVTRVELHNKYMAANMISVRPFKSLWLSVGNSTIYSEQSVEPAFLIPFLFFKSVDHTIYNRRNDAGSNAQMFGGFSWRPLRKLHVFSTLFIDELSIRNSFNKDLHTNWFSLKSGFRMVNVLPNLNFTFEYLRSNPMVYKHYISTTTYTHASYNLGHYLKDNSLELIGALDYIPLWWLHMELKYQYAQTGPDYEDNRVIRNPTTGELAIRGLPYLSSTQFEQGVTSLTANFQFVHSLHIRLQLEQRSTWRSNSGIEVPYYKGNSLTFAIGINYGF